MKTTDQNIHTRLALIALASLVLAALALPARAVIIASDTFSITESRPVGSALAGSATETGGLTWTASSNYVLAVDTANEDNGAVTAKDRNTSGGFSVPFTFAEYGQYGEVATLTFTMAYGRNNSSTWMGIGFSTTGHTSPTTNYLVWLYVDYSGNYAVRTKSTNLATGKITNFYRTNTYTYSISYNAAANTIVSVNVTGGAEANPINEDLLANYVFQTSPGAIGGAAFFGQYPGEGASASGTRIDSFQLEVTTAIPEPAAAAAWLAGAVAVLAACAAALRRSHC